MIPIFAKIENKRSSILATIPSFLNSFLPLLPSLLTYVLMIIVGSRSHTVFCIHMRVEKWHFVLVAVVKDVKN